MSYPHPDQPEIIRNYEEFMIDKKESANWRQIWEFNKKEDIVWGAHERCFWRYEDDGSKTKIFIISINQINQTEMDRATKAGYEVIQPIYSRTATTMMKVINTHKAKN